MCEVTMDKNVSIIIPTYNREAFLLKAVNSVLSQTSQNWELIIVDDGSTDDTPHLVEPYLSNKIKYIKKRNEGAPSARNLGALKAKADYIAFLDSDDFLDSNWVEEMLRPLRSTIGVVCCGVRRLDARGNEISTSLPGSLGQMFNNQVGKFTNGGVYLIRKDIFFKAGGFDEKLNSGQHTELSYRFIPLLNHMGLQIFNINKYLLNFVLHSEDRITTNPRSKLLGSLRTFKKHESKFIKNKDRAVNYLNVAAVSAAKLNKYKIAKSLLLKSIKIHPFHLLTLFRLIIVGLPLFRNIVWSKKRVFSNPLKRIIK